MQTYNCWKQSPTSLWLSNLSRSSANWFLAFTSSLRSFSVDLYKTQHSYPVIYHHICQLYNCTKHSTVTLSPIIIYVSFTTVQNTPQLPRHLSSYMSALELYKTQHSYPVIYHHARQLYNTSRGLNQLMPNLRSASSVCRVCRSRPISSSRLRIDSIRYWYGCWHSSSKLLAFFNWRHTTRHNWRQTAINHHDSSSTQLHLSLIDFTAVSGFPCLVQNKFHDPESIFRDPVVVPATCKYEDKQQLLTLHITAWQ